MKIKHPIFNWDNEWINKVGLSEQFGRPAHYSDRLTPYLRTNDKAGLIGKVVIDLGCGPYPLSNELDLSKHKRILIDITKDVGQLESAEDYPITLCLDLNHFADISDELDPYNLAFNGAIHIASEGRGKIDAIIASCIVDYVDWKNLFKKLDGYLNSNGLLFLSFGHGMRRYFHEEKPKNFEEVSTFMHDQLRYKILVEDRGNQLKDPKRTEDSLVDILIIQKTIPSK